VTKEEEKIVENYEIVEKLVGMMGKGRKEALLDMLAGPVGREFMVAPASSRTEFHSCYPGGLMQHSLNVVREANRLTKTLCPGRWPEHKVTFAALFHDLGKVGFGEHDPYYVRTDKRWKIERGELYDINPNCQRMPTSERGLFLLQQAGVVLDVDEYLAIRLNDGQYVRENEPYKMNEPDLALIIHWADMWATRQEKN
jgi:hypothetical protein